MAFVDTNILLRWLLNDHTELSLKAERLIAKAKPNSLVVTELIAAEIVYVLRSTGRDRHQTGEALLLIDRTAGLTYENSDLMLSIIDLLTDKNLDFADCYLLARVLRENTQLETFDNQLRRIHTNVVATTPKNPKRPLHL